MKRILLAMSSTFALIALMFGYRTSTIGPQVGSTAAGPAHIVTPGGSSTAGAGGSAGSAASGGTAAAGPASGQPAVVDGKRVQTGYGPLVIEITAVNGQITDVQAVVYPNSAGRTHSINSHALPILRTQALQTHGHKIDGVSGATYTSEGYATSLQSAIDLAGLK